MGASAGARPQSGAAIGLRGRGPRRGDGPRRCCSWGLAGVGAAPASGAPRARARAQALRRARAPRRGRRARAPPRWWVRCGGRARRRVIAQRPPRAPPRRQDQGRQDGQGAPLGLDLSGGRGAWGRLASAVLRARGRRRGQRAAGAPRGHPPRHRGGLGEGQGVGPRGRRAGGVGRPPARCLGGGSGSAGSGEGSVGSAEPPSPLRPGAVVWLAAAGGDAAGAGRACCGGDQLATLAMRSLARPTSAPRIAWSMRSGSAGRIRVAAVPPVVDGVEQLEGVLAGKAGWPVTSRRGCAEAEDVRAVVDLLGVADLLGRHVAGRAHGEAAAGPGEAHIGCEHLDQAEVGDLGDESAGGPRQHDVGRLEVPVDELLGVGLGDPGEDPERQGVDLRKPEPLPDAELLEGGPLDQLHDEPRAALHVDDVGDGDDVGVAEAGLDATLLEEAALDGRGGDREHLEGVLALEHVVLDLVDVGHPALADEGAHGVAIHDLPELEVAVVDAHHQTPTKRAVTRLGGGRAEPTAAERLGSPSRVALHVVEGGVRTGRVSGAPPTGR